MVHTSKVCKLGHQSLSHDNNLWSHSSKVFTSLYEDHRDNIAFSWTLLLSTNFSMASDSSTNNEIVWTEASVIDIKTFDCIKLLRLKVADKSLTFKPGQWVDFLIPNVSPFTGYSMTSPPSLLASSGVLDLAVKYSDYPPTLWVHEKCKMGDKVQIKVAGGFFYTPPSPSSPGELERDDMLLLAAGIGISPIYCILQHYLERDHRGGKVALLYSCKSPAEMVFKDEILEIARHHDFFTPKLYSSKDSVDEKDKKNIKEGRITESEIQEALSSLNQASAQVYICGPPAFLDKMETFCLSSGLPKDRIYYENW
ncbi:hypothetical protein RRG08_048258 [Elysia crispata]|uniref:Oxidoreductase NAD-binding domain-containing protein 1 n=1 Tax=Elysia crispata TaxID=231223 RepID=A0AAE1DMP0_9GAST|nr:hypothetical protein RRG08_048258 [Elysia crispata]